MWAIILFIPFCSQIPYTFLACLSSLFTNKRYAVDVSISSSFPYHQRIWEKFKIGIYYEIWRGHDDEINLLKSDKNGWTAWHLGVSPKFPNCTFQLHIFFNCLGRQPSKFENFMVNIKFYLVIQPNSSQLVYQNQISFVTKEVTLKLL